MSARSHTVRAGFDRLSTLSHCSVTPSAYALMGRDASPCDARRVKVGAIRGGIDRCQKEWAWVSTPANRQLMAEYIIRQFLLFSKARAECSPGHMLPSSLSDAEIRELLECIWIAERLRFDPGLDLQIERGSYRLADWVSRDLGDDALARAMTDAFEVFSAWQASDRLDPSVGGERQYMLTKGW